MHWTSWFHCSNNTSALPGIASPLKVFILGVPKHNPEAKVLIRCPTSGFARAGLGGWGGGPQGTHPPYGCAGTGDGDGCLGGTHPPPLGKVTSWSSPLGLLLPDGSPQGVGWGLLGVHAPCRVQSPGRDPPWVDTALGLWGFQALPGGNVECPHPGEGYQWVNKSHLSPLRAAIVV